MAQEPNPLDPNATREIQQEIETTREEMSETIEALEEHLQPRHLVAEAESETMRAFRERAQPALEPALQAMENARSSIKPLASQLRQQAEHFGTEVQSRLQEARKQFDEFQRGDGLRELNERIPVIAAGLAATGAALWVLSRIRE